MTTLIASSVVRGSQQGESHGGVYLIDLERQRVSQKIDWNTTNIDWQGRGWDRGLRGIAFDGARIFIAASNELFVYDQDFNQIASYTNPFLNHCHEIFRYKRRLYLTSTGFDAVLGFDLDQNRFSWGLRVSATGEGPHALPFDPGKSVGPEPSNQLHLNSVYCDAGAMYISGLKTEAMFAFDGKHINQIAKLPSGIHNAQPFRDGIIFNDTKQDLVRYVPADGPQCVFGIPKFDSKLITHADFDDSRIARQAFGRGLCAINSNLVAAGSSPSTITLHDLETMKTTLTINLSMDVRNAIHGLEVWPYSLSD